MKPGNTLDITIRFTTPVLGTVPKDPEVYKNFVLSKAYKINQEQNLPLEELDAELNNIEAVEDRGWTGFMRDKDGYFVLNYWIRGYFKSALAAIQETGDHKKIVAYKTRVDRFLHVRPRQIYFDTKGREPFVMERPLRAMTMRGPRVSLARSDAFPEGTELSFQVYLLDNNEISVKTIETALTFGEFEGLGQWRSGGYGQFEVVKCEWKRKPINKRMRINATELED